jgi:uncharacterized protein DUF3592
MSDEHEFVTSVLLVAVGLTVTLLLAWRTRRFLTRAARASGRISHIFVETRHWKGHGADHPAETTMYYTPHVEFSPEDGSLLSFAGLPLAGRSLYKQGDVVTVVYDRAKPGTTAKIEGPAVWWHVWFHDTSGHGVITAMRQETA